MKLFAICRNILRFATGMTLLSVASNGVNAETLQSLDENGFVQAFVEKIVLLYPGSSVKIDGSLEVTIVLKDGTEVTSYLNNAFARYKADTSNLDQILRDYAIAVVRPKGELDRAKIFPVIRHSSLVDVVPESGSDVDNVLATLPLSGDMLVFFVRDDNDNIQYLSQDEVRGLSTSPSELLKSSVEALGKHPPEFDIGSVGPFALVSGSMYVSSLVLFDQFWKDFPIKFKGDLVVFVVNRDTLLVTGSAETEGLDASRAMSKKWMEESPYPISDQPIVLRNGRWEAFIPE